MVFLNDAVAPEMEYRHKPDNLSVFREEDYRDVFFAWLPNKSVSLTLAYAQLGNIANQPEQEAVDASLQLSY